MVETSTLDPQDRDELIGIRDAALKHLLEDASDFNGRSSWRTIKQVKARIEPDRHPEFLEAAILTRLLGGAPLRRVRFQMKSLYLAQCARGTPEAFDSFHYDLELAKDKADWSGELPIPKSFARMDHTAVWAETGQVMKIVQEHVGDIWLNSGTLLGSVRDKSFILHDDDVDLALMLKGNSAEEAAASWVAAYQALRAAGLNVFVPPRNLRVMKIAGKTVKIDLFPAWQQDGALFVYPHTAGQLGSDALYPLGTCETSGLPVPADSESFLSLNYGESWRTPDPTFTFDWKTANRNFKAFKQAVYADPKALDQ